MGHSHRPTTKQQHKPFKTGGHASSRTLKDIAKGKIQPEKSNSCVQKVHTKSDRKNMAKQIQQNKKNALKAQAGFFGDSRGKASRVCALISLSKSIDPKHFVNGLQDYLEEPISESPNTTLHIKNFKQRLQFVVPASTSIMSILDAASIADYTIFLISANETLADNSYSRTILRALQSQGISQHFSVIPDLKYDPDSMIERNDKQCMEVRKMWEADLDRMFPVHHSTSMYVMDSPTEIANMIRSLCTTVPEAPSWRQSRAYLLPSMCEFDANDKLVMEGIVRGGHLDVDRMVHIPGMGDFAMDKIVSIPTGIEEPQVLAEPSENQDRLVSEDLDMDAIEPDEAEPSLSRGVRLDDHYYMDDNEEEVPVIKKIPKGTSEYQATWITDETSYHSDEELPSSEDESDEAMSVSGAPASTYAPTQAEEAHEELSEEEEARQLAEYRAQIKDDKEFPDEVDFDPRIPARERFKKYRGLKDFRTSNWDPEEIEANTPSWYRQILKFTNYKATRNRVLKSKSGLQAGTRIRMYLNDVPRRILETPPLVVWANREFEHRRAVNNMTIQLEPDSDPIKSKTELIIQIAHRRFIASPIFSQNINATSNGLVRYERFARDDKLSHATFTGPAIIDRGTPVLYFLPRRTPDSEDRLVGTGSFASVSHTRLTIKRALLTGAPYKIHKRLVTVRYMFHSRADILFFKAIRLDSKFGRRGYIKEPLGTHGYMKTTWDKPVGGQDTVSMALYKRVYPRLATYYRP